MNLLSKQFKIVFWLIFFENWYIFIQVQEYIQEQGQGQSQDPSLDQGKSKVWVSGKTQA